MRIVLAYSGGLDTSVAIPWLAEKYGAEVVAVTMDLGQGRELDHIRERALALGAVRAHVLDLREEFAHDFILPALQAGAIYEDRYPLATALGRPLIAKHLVRIAEMEGASAIAHGCTGKGNDQVRLDVSARALNPDIRVIAPAREWGMTRPDEIEYARARGIPVPASIESPYSTDANLWGRSIECGVLEDPWCEPPEEIYTLTKSPAECPDLAAYLEVEFEAGVPVKVNGVPMSPVELIGSIETIAGSHGVGRVDMVENRLVGIKSREIYEAPAAVVLHAAHKELEKLVIPRDLERVKHDMARLYADIVYNGLWFTPTRAAIDAFAAKIQERVTGTIRVKLFKGNCSVVGRKSPFALYDHGLATYDAGDLFDHTAAEGFIKIWGLPIETAARKNAAGALRPAGTGV
ncbi:MAG TPA: argininosuccinate synthase [Vicinamibacterales bacterium]|nr:argininosuccinate synthase [Vicinamibacterales bacterium]